MKKILSVTAFISLLIACNNKKEEEQKSSNTDTTVQTTTPSTTSPTTNAPATETASGIKADVQFADPEVQKVADDYATFIEKYKGGTALDRQQTKVYLQEVRDWTGRISEVSRKLASNPTEVKKWTAWAKRMADKYQVKVNK